MLQQPCHCRGAQPWVTLMLLLGPLFLVALSWGPQGQAVKEDQSALELYFPATVEYALHEFNLKSRDRNAYKVVRVLKSWREKTDISMVFSMELQFGRTRCGKFDEDIDNCPLQGNPDLNNTVTCFFTISTDPWRTKFDLLNDTCLEGHQ